MASYAAGLLGVAIFVVAGLPSGAASHLYSKPEGLPAECDAAGRQTSKDATACSNVTVQQCSTSAGFDAKNCVWLPCELHHGNCTVAVNCDMNAAKNVKAPGYIVPEKGCEANGQKVAEFGDTTVPHYFDKRYKGKIGSAIPNVEPARGIDLIKYDPKDAGGCMDQLKIPYKSLVSTIKPEEKQDLIATLKTGALFTTQVQCECDLVLHSTRSYCYCNIEGQKENICDMNTIVKVKGVYDLQNNAIEGARSSCLAPYMHDTDGPSGKAPLGDLYPLGASATNSTSECQKKCDRTVGCNTINVGGGWCYLDMCNESIKDHTRNGLKLDKGFDILRKTGTVQQVESKFKPAPSRLTPAQTQFAAELAAKEPCIQGKVLHVPRHAQPTIAELKAEHAKQNELRAEAFKASLEGYRQNENLARQLSDDADRLMHKAQVLEAFVQRKSMSKTLQAQLQSKKPKEKAQLKAKRQSIADKVRQIEETFVPANPRAKSTWSDIRARTSKIPTVIATRPMPSIHDGDNYNASMYPVQLTSKQMLLDKKSEEQAEIEAAAIEENLGDASAASLNGRQLSNALPAKRSIDPKVELSRYEKLMHESEGAGREPVRLRDTSIPEQVELI